MDQVVQQLFYGAYINAKNNDGATPLHFAAISGHKNIAELLIANGADVKARAKHGGTPLYFAAVMGHKDVADLLIAHGAKAETLNIAAISENKEMAEMLIAKGMDFNAMEKIRIQKIQSNLTVREEENLWEKAQSSEDIKAVQDYLEKFPNGSHVAAVQDKLAAIIFRQEDQIWQQAQDGESIQAYLDRYPGGIHAAAAQEKLASIHKAEDDSSQNTEGGWTNTETTIRDCPDCPDMVVIPAGSFEMAEADSALQVTLKRFALGRSEVTQGQWKAVMGNNPSHFASCGDDCPVEQVSWNEIQVFIQKLSTMTGKQYRLPSEAEWEYACMAGERQEYCGSDDLDAVAWHEGNSGGSTHASAGKKANAFGLYDMSGNVWEWVEDSYHADYNGAPTDGSAWQGDDKNRVLRGGSWIASPRVGPSAGRNWHEPEKSFYNLGFRLARTLP